MQHGLHKTNPEKGCKKSDCQLYHPPLCYGSMKYRECRTKGCKRKHLPGTKFRANQVSTSNYPKKSSRSKGKDKRRSKTGSTSTSSKTEFSREPVVVPFQHNSYASAVTSQLMPSQCCERVQSPPFLGHTAPDTLEQKALELAKQLLAKALIGQ